MKYSISIRRIYNHLWIITSIYIAKRLMYLRRFFFFLFSRRTLYILYTIIILVHYCISRLKTFRSDANPAYILLYVYCVLIHRRNVVVDVHIITHVCTHCILYYILLILFPHREIGAKKNSFDTPRPAAVLLLHTYTHTIYYIHGVYTPAMHQNVHVYPSLYTLHYIYIYFSAGR